MTNPSVLIVDEDANEFARAVAAEMPIPTTACTSAAAALDSYKEQTILLGNPAMIAEVLPDMPTVEWVQSTWAGVTPLLAIDRRDYVLTGIKDVFGPQMAEYAIGYLLAHELRIIKRFEEQRARSWYEAPSGILQNKTLGIMGTGSISQDIARAARGLGLSVVGVSRSGTAQESFDSVLPVGSLPEFLSGLDYLVSVLPHTPETDNLLNGDSLALVPSHCYFINIGRANVVNDEALIAALTSDRLAGAVLDVFDEEPIPDDSPLWDTPNLLITAHIAAISHPELIAPVFIENYRRFVSGETLRYVVNLELGY